MNDAPAPSTAFAAALLTAFLDAGVRELVVAPGSRSQALALVAAELDRAGRARLRVRVDERDAAFLALGLGKESGRPAVVITTSGTAVANLHPAVLEARHSGVPMIVLTADRPEELRGIGSNQTTDHVGILAGTVARTFDVGAPTGEPGEDESARSLARDATAAAAHGPVHVNVAFTEPLSSPWTASPVAERAERDDETSRSSPGPFVSPAARSGTEDRRTLRPGRRTAVLAGAGAGESAEQVARELGAVLFAEVASGAHFGPQLVVPYRAVIRDEAFLDGLERLVVFGHPTLSREAPWLVERAASSGVDVLVVRTPGVEAYNPGHSVTEFADAVEVQGSVNAVSARSWYGPWVAASRAFLERTEDVPTDVHAAAREKARNELAAVRAEVTRRALVDAVWRATWPHDRLVVAASRLIRELDRFAPGKRVAVHANRGLAGIDGTISTAVGVALGSGAVTRLLTGDLAFLHDVGGLAFGKGEERPRVLVIVGNDGGGTIFDDLEVADGRAPSGASAGEAEASSGADGDSLTAYDRVMLTPQTASIESLAGAYGWEYRRVEQRGDLDSAISACTGPTVVEVPLAR